MDYLQGCLNDMINNAGGAGNLACLIILENSEWFDDGEVVGAKRHCKDNKIDYSKPGLPTGKIVYLNRNTHSRFTVDERQYVLYHWYKKTQFQLARNLKISMHRLNCITAELGLSEPKLLKIKRA